MDLGKYVGKSIKYTNYDLSNVSRAYGTSRNIPAVTKSEWERVGHYHEEALIERHLLENLLAENLRIQTNNRLMNFLVPGS